MISDKEWLYKHPGIVPLIAACVLAGLAVLTLAIVWKKDTLTADSPETMIVVTAGSRSTN